MSVDHRRRLHLYESARERLGEAAADTLMELLPMDGTELATKSDLAVLSAELRAEMQKLSNHTLRWTISTMIAAVALAFGAAQLA